MPLKHAIIGYGGMGSWHHDSIKNKVDVIETVAAYDIRPEQLEKAAEDGLKPYETLEALLADKEIDLVTIATPNNFHKSLSIAALEAGKHVVCEKPVTLNAAELEEIIAVSEKTGKVFTVHQNRRWDKDFRIVREAISKGMVGNPFYIESRVQGSGGLLHGWRSVKINGGGMVYDWGVHLIDQLMWMIDSPVTELWAQLFCVHSDECDDNFKLHLAFENGISALVQIDTYCFIPLPRWHVSGNEATLVVENWSCDGKIIRAIDDGVEWTENIVYTEAGPTRTMAPRNKNTELEEALPSVSSDWSEYYKNVADAINGKAELIVKPAQAMRVMKLIDAAFLSAKTGKSVSGPF